MSGEGTSLIGSLVELELLPLDRDAATTVEIRSAALGVHVVDPLTDDRWDEFVDRHSKASAFHKRGWLNPIQN